MKEQTKLSLPQAAALSLTLQALVQQHSSFVLSSNTWREEISTKGSCSQVEVVPSSAGAKPRANHAHVPLVQ